MNPSSTTSLSSNTTTTDEAEGSSGARHCPFDFSDALAFDPVMGEMLREAPLTRVRMNHGQGTAWIVTRHAEVRQVTSDPRFSRAAAVGRDYSRMTPIPIAPADALMMLDPPHSFRIRAALARAFSTYGTRRLRRLADESVVRLLDRFTEAGPGADFVREVAAPLPMYTIWDVLGIPQEDHRSLRARIDPIKDTDDREDTHAHQSVHDYLRELAARRRSIPADDLLSALLHPRGGATALTDDEVAALAVSLILGGHDNMTNQVANITYTLMEHPHVYRLLVDEPGRLNSVLDEVLRHIPYHRGVGTPRIAMEDVDLSGHRIAAGEVVYVSYVAANHDPHHFEDPEALVPGRSPVDHLTFGWGPHRCPATALVMVVLETVFTHLPRTLPTLRLAAAPDDIPWNATSVLRSPLTLPLTW
ncbi:cytochrome P450 [Streptomyces sp. FIT100]|uniref:cytochrome P450 n=1 Tax=Streptomyces sp. FIT100 TaxID=2837956 RepID=UPI0021C7C94C|nr:cytochrome P450 [Streptomyces sp. FIT100]UUN25263.1 cytochrome P450 [Streptomyces sp. FIT100]